MEDQLDITRIDKLRSYFGSRVNVFARSILLDMRHFLRTSEIGAPFSVSMFLY